MTSRVPYFMRRLWRLFEAKRALFDGEPERALDHLRDPSLALSPHADELRARAMEVLYRSAAHSARLGRDGSVARLLDVAAGEDPERAREWRLKLAGGTATAEHPVDGLRQLLAEMRDSPEGRDLPRSTQRQVRTRQPRQARAGAPIRFQLAIDDGGEFLVVSGSEIVLGHARAGRADVPLLADIESEHARLVQSESFHGGPSWSVEELGGSVEVEGRGLGGQPHELSDGDEVRLSPNLAFHFRVPESASASVVIELLHGAESEGAQRVLLFAEGRAGRVRIGPKANRHVPVAGLEHEVHLALEPGELIVTCDGGVRVFGSDGGSDEAAMEKRVPCPPSRRVDVTVNARPSQRPPFALAVTPLDEDPR